MSNSLYELQSLFLAALRNPPGNEAEQSFMTHIGGSAGLDAAARTQIYRHHTELALVRALRATYPRCEALLGKKRFREQAVSFAREHPSMERTLHHYGCEFSRFLAATRQKTDPEWLETVAEMEWHTGVALNCEDEPSLNQELFAELATETPEAIIFSMRRSLAVIRSRWDVRALWESWESTLDPKPNSIAQAFVLWQQGGRVHVEAYSETEVSLLEVMRHERTLGSLADTAASGEEEAYAELISDFVKRGWIVGARMSCE